jgi:hypothetical protein
MKCKETLLELEAYLNGELEEKKSKAISEHLEKCINCKRELDALLQQNETLKQLEPIEPSPNFDTVFWQKVTEAEQSAIKENSWLKIPRISWLPIPAMSLLVILILFQLFVFSFTIYARSTNIRNQIISQAKGFTINHPLNPVSFLNICKGICKALCKCSRDQGVSPECVCGRCKADNIKGGSSINDKI